MWIRTGGKPGGASAEKTASGYRGAAFLQTETKADIIAAQRTLAARGWAYVPGRIGDGSRE
jgi:hypothetical protein